MDRVILHCDCNSFFASCECVLDPKLKEVPMAVCGNPENRHGIILAKNELAKKYDIKTAETIWQAKRKCPSLVFVTPHHGLYSEFSKKCNAIYKEYTDMVEPFGIDESWLDVTASRLLFGTGEQIADTIRERFKSELGLTCSVGVSFTKSFAKLGSDYKKPDATTVISRENYQTLVWKMPVDALLFVGKSAGSTLKKMNIFTIGDLACSDRDTVIKHLGKLGGLLHDYANGIDPSPVETVYATHIPKSVSNGMTFKRDLKTDEDIKRGVMLVADELTVRMRKSHMKYTLLSVNIKYSDFSSCGKQKQLDFATNLMRDTVDIALELLYAIYEPGRPIRSITIAGAHLVPEEYNVAQTSMFSDTFENREKQASLENAVAHIREKYGHGSMELVGLMDSDDI